MKIEPGLEEEASPSNAQAQHFAPPSSLFGTLNQPPVTRGATAPGKNVETPTLYWMILYCHSQTQHYVKVNILCMHFVW